MALDFVEIELKKRDIIYDITKLEEVHNLSVRPLVPSERELNFSVMKLFRP
jgi:hypothetical protein